MSVEWQKYTDVTRTSVRRLRPVVEIAVDRLHGHALDASVPQHVENDFAPGRAARPQTRIEVRLASYGLAAHRYDDVPDAERRLVGRTVARQPCHDHVALGVLGRHAEPGSRGAGRPAAGYEIGEHGLELIDRHEQVARHGGPRAHRVRNRQRADTDQAPLAVEQRGA